MKYNINTTKGAISSITASRNNLKHIVNEISRITKRDQNKEDVVGAVKRHIKEHNNWRKLCIELAAALVSQDHSKLLTRFHKQLRKK